MKSQSLLVIMIATFTLLAVSGCKMAATGDAPGSGSTLSNTGGGNGGGGPAVGGQAVVGVRSTTQVMATMASATGVDPYTGFNGDQIHNFYLESRTTFSTRGSFDEAAAMSTMNLLSVAAYFAREMLNAENANAQGGRFGIEIL